MIDALKRDVAALATSEGRMIGTRGHRLAREYLCERLGALGLTPLGASFAMPYEAEGWSLANVMGVVPGAQPTLPPVVLAAHYDTCGPLPGADDNAAAIAIALAVAEALLAQPAERSVIIALFDGEEPPAFLSDAMGSIHWYRHQRTGPVHAAVVLDLVGHDVQVPGLEDLVFVTGAESDPALPGVLAASPAPGVRVHPALNRYVGDLSDHHIFRKNQRPYLFLSCGRWAHYHARTDTPDRLNYAKMRAIAQLVQSMVSQVARTELRGPWGEGDTLAAEVAALNRHFTPLMGGVPIPRSRLAVDAFVTVAMAALGL